MHYYGRKLALPYLFEANRLEREGADQQQNQELLEKAHNADSSVTSFYIGHWSIIKKMQKQQQEPVDKDKDM